MPRFTHLITVTSSAIIVHPFCLHAIYRNCRKYRNLFSRQTSVPEGYFSVPGRRYLSFSPRSSSTFELCFDLIQTGLCLPDERAITLPDCLGYWVDGCGDSIASSARAHFSVRFQLPQQHLAFHVRQPVTFRVDLAHEQLCARYTLVSDALEGTLRGKNIF